MKTDHYGQVMKDENGQPMEGDVIRERIDLEPSATTACSPSYYTFRNRDGQTFQLRGDLTMEDLVRMGYGDIRLVQPETPLNPHEWRCCPLMRVALA